MAGRTQVRTREPLRTQGRMCFEVLEDVLASEHRARLLWRVVETLDLTAFLAGRKAVRGGAGRDVTSVRMLMTLWLYATSLGVGSAREIERRIGSDDAFRWIVGGQSVGRTILSEFRRSHMGALDQLLSEVLGTLLHKGLLSLELMAQDGTRIRASASAPSFRQESSLQECLEQARLHVKAVLAEGDDPESSEGEKRAREAAALDYQRRVEEALAVVQQLRSEGKDKPRASTTDAEARVMKMGDGGFRPAYNVQFATAGEKDGGPRTIVGVRVTNVGSDVGSITPMLEEIERRTGQLPETLLADGGHLKFDCLRWASAKGVSVLVPLPPPSKDPKTHRGSYDEPIAAWRERMQTPEAKELYRARAGLAELPNARFKGRLGLGHLLVRGLNKVTCVVLLGILAHNILSHAVGLLS
jgi:transposase